MFPLARRHSCFRPKFERKIRSQSTYSKQGRLSLMLNTQQTNFELEDAARNREGPASEADKWKAVLTRDETQDGTFVFGVRSTGIYCKPSCPARHPHIEPVVFFPGPGEAEQSGFRACERCCPAEQGSSQRTALVPRVPAFVEPHLDDKLTLPSLIRAAVLRPFP